MHKIDPFYYFLRLVLARFYKSDLGDEDLDFVNENLNKHRIAQWVNLVVTMGSGYGVAGAPPESLGTLIPGLLGPVMVLGAAWFSISFGGIPSKLIDVAMSVTFWMFTAFIASFSAMFVAVAVITPWPVWPALATIYIGTVISCVQYDTTDGLKAGLDETQLKHSRAALMDYATRGIDPDGEEGGEKES